jgi:hypothetical protein
MQTDTWKSRLILQYLRKLLKKTSSKSFPSAGIVFQYNFNQKPDFFIFRFKYLWQIYCYISKYLITTKQLII